MSFPNIPDVNPTIDIDACEAVNLLLASIAMEEISLSRLMDAERDKIETVLDACRRGGCSVHELAEINRSVDDMLKTMIKLQMLLQFKLENVRELTPCTTTTTTSTTTSTTSTCSTAAQCCCCCLMGTGKGCVSNARDALCGRPAALHAFVPCVSGGGSAIRYTVSGEEETLRFYAAGCGVRADCFACADGELRLCGAGTVKKSRAGEGAAALRADYTLTVRCAPCGELTFRMRLSGCGGHAVLHDSGFVRVGRGSGLCMKC